MSRYYAAISWQSSTASECKTGMLCIVFKVPTRSTFAVLVSVLKVLKLHAVHLVKVYTKEKKGQKN